MTDRINDREWWIDRVKILKAIQKSMQTLTTQANLLLEPLIEIMDEDRDSLAEAMQGETEWYDFQTVAHWIEEAESHMEGMKE